MTPDFWRNKRVLITGHTGFKGSWLALWLNRLQANVLGYSLPPPTSPSLFDNADVEVVVETTNGDIRDSTKFAAEVVRFQPDIILHLAAQSVVLSSYEDPVETYSTNVVGTANVLNAMRRLNKRCAFVNVTTDKVYENRQWLWGYRENDQLGGRDPYSNSKACAELVARAFRDSFFAAGDAQHRIGIASARAGNVIGGGDWTAHQLIPETIAAFRENRSVVLRHPEAIRPWQHVLDCLSGYLTLAEALFEDPEKYEGEWNFGPTDADMQPVSYIVEHLAKSWGCLSAWVTDGKA
ncbi:MAG: CDP-glucose 4,6-dehydratase, partial [Steroidobacteraceae bacterium]